MDSTALIARLQEFGVTILVKDGKPTLRQPADPAMRELVKKLLPAVAEHRAAILRHYLGSTESEPEAEPTPEPGEAPPTVCDLCEGIWYCPPNEIAELARGPWFCERGRVWRTTTDGNGIVHEKTDGCPFKEGW